MFFPQRVYGRLTLAHHYTSWRGSPDHTVRPGLCLHLSEAILKDLTLTLSLVKALPTILFSNLSITNQSSAGCPSSANNSSRSWMMGKKAIAWWANTEPNNVWACQMVIKEPPLLQLERASPEQTACLCVMGIYTGGYSGTLILVSPKLSETFRTLRSFHTINRLAFFRLERILFCKTARSTGSS